MRNFVHSVMLLAVLLVLSLSIVSACTGTPDERAAKVAKAETDLCKARAAEVLIETAEPSLVPAPGSVREKIETAEDTFCAARAAADAGK